MKLPEDVVIPEDKLVRYLYVVTVWITLETSGETRFVTLFPDKERHG